MSTTKYCDFSGPRDPETVRRALDFDATKQLSRKGYSGTVEYDAEDDLLVGRIIGINDSICYHGTSIEEIRSSFIDAVENYLSVCEELGKAPEMRS